MATLLTRESGYRPDGASALGDEPGLGFLQGLQDFSMVMAGAGIGLSMIGAYHATEAQKYRLETDALNLDFEASMAGLNARQAEQDAQAILDAGQREKGRATLRYGQMKAASRARQAAAGVQAGVGSAAEVQTSIEVAKDIDAMTIDANAVRAAGDARMRAVDMRNRALLARTGAANARSSAQSLRPWISSLTSLVGGAGQVASQWLWTKWR